MRGGIGNTVEEDEARGELIIDSPTKCFSVATIPGYSKLEVRPRPIGFHGSLKCGTCNGEPKAEDDTEAPDSDEAESTGG
jgi:hypothetical protein